MSITNTREHERGRRRTRTVRLLCTDFDGTLLDSQGGISDRTLSALAEASRAGITVAGVTGRPMRDALPVTRGHGLTGLLVCSNGAVTVDARTGEIHDCRGFEPAGVTEILGALRSGVPGIALGVESLGGLRLEPEFSALVPHPWAHEPMAAWDTGPRDGDPVVQILAAHAERPVEELAGVAAALLGAGAQVTRSSSRFLEISAPGVDKGDALLRLAGRLGVPLEHTVAVGDMPNDLPMLGAAGLAAAVAGAHEDVLRAADIVVPGNDDDGVATLIQLVLPRMLTRDSGCI